MPLKNVLSAELLRILRCPASKEKLNIESGQIVSKNGLHKYTFTKGIPDLRAAPKRLSFDLPWYEPWEDIESLRFDFLGKAKTIKLPPEEDVNFDNILKAVKLAKNGEIVLDVGCGERKCEGYFISRELRYIAVDYEIRGIGPHLLADAHNLPFEDQSVGMYYSNSVFEHLVCPLTAVFEAFRVLKKGGVIIGSTAFIYGFHDKASFSHMSYAGVLSMLRTVGFVNIKIWPGWYYPRAISSSVFGEGPGKLWYLASWFLLTAMDFSFVWISNIARTLFRKKRIDPILRRVYLAGGFGFIAEKG